MKTLTKAEEELFYWYTSGGDNFSARLYSVIAKADNINRAKLSLGFPDEVECMNKFQGQPGYWESVEERMRKA